MVEMERRDGLGCILKIERTEFIAWLSGEVQGGTRDNYEAPSLDSWETGTVIHKAKENGRESLFGGL